MSFIRAGDLSIVDIDEEKGNTNEVGKWFFRIERNQGTASASEKCLIWYQWQLRLQFILERYLALLEPCPCSLWQAWWDGRFYFHTLNCVLSRNRIILPIRVEGQIVWLILYQQCCYSIDLSSFGALIVGLPKGGHVNIKFYNLPKELSDMYSDDLAYDYCCEQSNECKRYYEVRPSRNCDGYQPPIRSKPLSIFDS